MKIHCHIPFPERFEMQYIPEPNTGCWLWTGGITSSGYPLIRYRGARIGAHRAAYLEFMGAIPQGMDVCHKCDEPSCVNPRHLFVGTRQDNMADCFSKGRLSRGEARYNAKLTEADILVIRGMSGTSAGIAARFGITRRYAGAIRERRTWKHI